MAIPDWQQFCRVSGRDLSHPSLQRLGIEAEVVCRHSGFSPLSLWPCGLFPKLHSYDVTVYSRHKTSLGRGPLRPLSMAPSLSVLKKGTSVET